MHSVVSQTLLPREVILVDDASQDDTWRTLENLAAKFPGWIRVYRMEENRGAASTRNAGWGKAVQPYIAFLDSDDSWHPEKIKFQFGYMNSNPHIGLSGHLYGWSNDLVRWGSVSTASETLLISATALMLKSYFPTPSVMLKSNVPLRFRESQRYSEDALLWQQLALSGVNIVRLETQLVMLHKAPYGISGLSAQLWEMECAELNNFCIHYHAKKIGLAILMLATMLSVAKFFKRLMTHAWRKLL